MNPREASEILGCSISHIRNLIRSKKLKYKKVPDKNNRHGYVYDIPNVEVNRLKVNPSNRGWPRGKKRGVSPKLKAGKDKLIDEVADEIEKYCDPKVLLKFHRLVKQLARYTKSKKESQTT